MPFDVVEFFQTCPFHRWLDCEVLRMDPEEVALRLAFRAEFAGGPDDPYFHGGVISALIDAAGTFAVIAALDCDCVTLDYRVDFLRSSANAEALTARARAAKTGRTIGVADVEVFDDGGTLVALGRVTLFVSGEPLSSSGTS